MDVKSIACGITLLCILKVHVYRGAGLRVSDSEEYRLRRELFGNMDVMVRPVKSHSDIVNVSFSLTVKSLSDLENKRQMLITSVWISQRWHNPFLAWDKNKFGGIDRLHVSPKEIWVPDVILYNNGDNKVYQAGHTELFKTWVVLQSNGICTWESPANIESECDIDIAWFPFDQQNCSLIFESATYGSELLVIRSMQPKEHKIIVSDSNGEWQIIKTHENVSKRQRHPNATEKYSSIMFTLEIERKWVYYIMFLILPCVICTLLVLVSFAIPPENGERIGFCSTIMIAVSVFLLLIAEMLPEKSDTLPILGVYYIITMLEIAFALMATILVLRAYHSTSDPPACFKALYRASKARKKKKLEVKKKINMNKFLKRNAVASEMTPVENEEAAASIPRGPSSIDKEQKPVIEDNDELNDEDNRKIWRSVAVFFDRCFFWLFLLAFIGSSGYLIMYRPNFNLGLGKLS